MEETFPKVRTRSIEIVDSSNRVCLALKAENGVGAIDFLNGMGNSQLNISCGADSVAIELKSKMGDLRVALAINRDGAAYLQFFDAHGLTRLLL